MDLLPYLRSRRRRIAVLALIPVVAMIATLAVSLGASDHYVSEARVVVPAPQANFRAARVDAATSFASSVQDPTVTSAAAEQIGVAPAAVHAALQVNRDADTVTVRAETPLPGSTAAAIVVESGNLAFDQLFAPAIAESQAALYVALAREAEADEALRAFETERGTIGVLDRYRALNESLAGLRAQRATARVEGRTDEARALTELIDEGQRQVAELEPLVPDYRRLLNGLERADAQISDAQRALDDVIARRDGAKTQLQTSATPPMIDPIGEQIGTQLLAAAAVGLLLAAGGLGLLELLRPMPYQEPSRSLPRRSRRDVGADPGPFVDADGAEVDAVVGAGVER